MGHTMHNWLVIITPQPSILCISQKNDNNNHMHNMEEKMYIKELRHWVKLFFGVKVIAMNSHRLLRKGWKNGTYNA